MDIIHPRLETDRANTGHPEELRPMCVTEISAIHHSIIVLLKAVAVDRVVEEESEIGIQVELIILGVGVREKLTSGPCIVVIVQPSRTAERLAAFRRIDGAEAIESAVRDRPQRDFSRRVPLSFMKGRGQA